MVLQLSYRIPLLRNVMLKNFVWDTLQNTFLNTGYRKRFVQYLMEYATVLQKAR